MITYDDYEEAILGFATVWSEKGERNDVMVYDGEKIVDILVDRDGMTPEDALEFIEFNIEGGYLGPTTPIVVWPEALLDDYEH
jgi:hypothetical protein